MKTYSKNSAVRKPMMYGSSVKKMMGGGMMGSGMMQDKKNKTAMGMMGMMYGSSVKKMKKK